MSNKWIPILVRLEDFEDITRILATREASRDNTAGEELPGVIDRRESDGAEAEIGTREDVRLREHQPWSRDDLARLAEGKTLTTQRWSLALDVCAKDPLEWLPTSEVAKRSGMSINEWRDAPRKITRHLKRNYPNVPQDKNGDAFWPLLDGGGGIPDNGGEVWWTITPEMADLWNDIRGN